jgi:hypothetical protein
VNKPRPIRKIRRQPKTSASRPPQMSSPPNASAYAVKIHCWPASLNRSAGRIAGSAIVTIVKSRTTTN